MTKIVVTNNQNFNEAQIARLNKLGDVIYFDDLPKSAEEYLSRIESADVICSGTAGFQDAFREMKNVYVSVSFVSVAFVDLAILKGNNVTLSNAPGINRFAVSEWIISMTVLLLRDLYSAINRTESYRIDGSLPPLTKGVAGSNVTILGKGNIGKQSGAVLDSMGMKVTYCTRDMDMHDSVRDADIVIDCLSSNESTRGLLGQDFFAAMKNGSYFVSVTRDEITDSEALIAALDSGHLLGAAMDCGGILVGDTENTIYKKYRNHPKILVTPHISYSTKLSMKLGNDVMIDNVEAWLQGKPQNVVT